MSYFPLLGADLRLRGGWKRFIWAVKTTLVGCDLGRGEAAGKQCVIQQATLSREGDFLLRRRQGLSAILLEREGARCLYTSQLLTVEGGEGVKSPALQACCQGSQMGSSSKRKVSPKQYRDLESPTSCQGCPEMVRVCRQGTKSACHPAVS